MDERLYLTLDRMQTLLELRECRVAMAERLPSLLSCWGPTGPLTPAVIAEVRQAICLLGARLARLEHELWGVEKPEELKDAE